MVKTLIQKSRDTVLYSEENLVWVDAQTAVPLVTAHNCFSRKEEKLTASLFKGLCRNPSNPPPRQPTQAEQLPAFPLSHSSSSVCS